VNVKITARQCECDANGHVNHTAYLEWADRARSEYLREAGLDVATFVAAGIGPVILDLRVRFAGEILAGDDITVTVEPQYTAGKTFTVRHRFLRKDGLGNEAEPAELTAVMGLLDYSTRRLVIDPIAQLRGLTSVPGAQFTS
jgi:acyl-CoA thioester hydrolase